jgi:hypothetical protein
MLVTLSTLLARAQRAKRAVVCCRVTSLEMAQACLEAAIQAKEALALEVALEGPGSVPGPLLMDAVVHLAYRSTALVSVIACVLPQETEVQAVLEGGVSAVRFAWTSSQAGPRRKDLTRWAVRAGTRYGVEVIGDPGSSLTPLRLRSFAEATGATVLYLDLDTSEEGRKAATVGYVHELAAGATVPLMFPELSLSSAQRQRYVEAGVRCFTLGEELEQAYAAGLRTAIRDRTVWQFAKLSQPAVQAVRHTVLSYLGTPT